MLQSRKGMASATPAGYFIPCGGLFSIVVEAAGLCEADDSYQCVLPCVSFVDRWPTNSRVRHVGESTWAGMLGYSTACAGCAAPLLLFYSKWKLFLFPSGRAIGCDQANVTSHFLWSLKMLGCQKMGSRLPALTSAVVAEDEAAVALPRSEHVASHYNLTPLLLASTGCSAVYSWRILARSCVGKVRWVSHSFSDFNLQIILTVPEDKGRARFHEIERVDVNLKQNAVSKLPLRGRISRAGDFVELHDSIFIRIGTYNPNHEELLLELQW